VTAERIERLEAETAFANLGKSKKKGDAAKLEIAEGRLLQESVRGVLVGMVAAGGKAGPKPVHDGKAFAKTLSAAFKKASVSVPVGVMKAVMAALSERDESAPAVLDAKGKPEPDADLRDTESVPLIRAHRGLLRARGEAARARRVDRRKQDQGGLRDPVHPPLLQVPAAAPAERDRGGDSGA
jgi:hypothetical protein